MWIKNKVHSRGQNYKDKKREVLMSFSINPKNFNLILHKRQDFKKLKNPFSKWFY